jgi:hypothetical protein
MTAAVTAHLSPIHDCAILCDNAFSGLEPHHGPHRRHFTQRAAARPARTSQSLRFILHNLHPHHRRFSSTPFIRRAQTQRINGYSFGVMSMTQARLASNQPMKNYFGILVAVLAYFALTAFSASAHPGSGIAVNSEGEVYFVHTGVGVFKVDREGRMARYAEPGFHFMIFDGEGRFARQRWPRFPDGEIRTAGTNPKLLLASSFPLAIGPDGALYYPQAGSDRQVHVMRVAPLGESVAFATLPTSMEIGPGGKPSRAQWIHGLAAGHDGTLYYSEQSAVQRIGPDGSVSLVADASTVADCDPPSGMSGPPHGPLLRGLDV